MDIEYLVLVNGEWVPLVPALSPDCCERCAAGIDVGYTHEECYTMTPDRQALSTAVHY